MTDLVKRGRVAVDWDGTCVEDNTWPGMGDWLPGAVDALRRLAEIYDEVVIWTLRTAPFEIDEKTPRDPMDQVAAIRGMLVRARLPLNVTIWTRPYKPPAEFYIDNRALRFEGMWGATLVELNYIREREHYANHKEERMEHAHEFEGMRVITLEDFLAGRYDKAVPVEAYNQPAPSDEDFDWWNDLRADEWNALEAEIAFQHAKEQPIATFGADGWRVDDTPDHFEGNLGANIAGGYEPVMREFETGATRNNDANELDYEGFLSPLSLWAYASYMHTNRFQADGVIRDSDNWQKGIPVDSYRKSLIRHVMDLWLNQRGFTHLSREDTVDALCAIIFNAQGMLHELLKDDSAAQQAA